MKILVVGQGGREHAIAWKLAQSPLVQHVYAAPGNAGTHREPKVENIPIDPLHFADLADFAKFKQIDFTIVGPEAPLAAGIKDYFQSKQLRCLGPTKQAAQLESSKVFAKAFMQRHHIPTAKSQTFSELAHAYTYLESCTFPIVIKADGLAAGKGVVITYDLQQAQRTLEDMLTHKHFGEAGNQIIIEDFIQGEEVSFIVLCDSKHYLPLATSQDHKTRDDNDQGPNTGGMGAYSPAPIVTPDIFDKIIKQVIEPTLAGMAAEGNPYEGFLYAGLMITPAHEINVLEYNCRFGDPETQPILMRLTSDFAEMCDLALTNKLDTYTAKWDPQVALGVVLAATGYPDAYRKGDIIPTLNDIPPSKNYKIFHAGTKLEDGSIITDGGRVLCVTAFGHSFQEAQKKTYALVKKVTWDGVFYRQDIGHRAIK